MRHAAAARREEGEYLHGSLINELHRRGGPRSATLRAKTWRTKGGVAPQSQNASAMLRSSRLALRPSDLRATIAYL